jgi:predicted transposase/invertase (TIGR01784 family)
MPDNRIYDKSYKRLLSKKQNFIKFLKTFVEESWVSEIDEDSAELINSDFIPKDFREREADLIYKLKFGAEEIYIYTLVELQSTVDYTMPIRLLIYLTEIYKRIFFNADAKLREQKKYRLPAVIPIVLYNGSDSWTVAKSFREYQEQGDLFGERLINFTPILVDLNSYDDEKLLNEYANLIAVIFAFDKTRDLSKIKETVRKGFKIFSGLSAEEQTDFTDWLKDVFSAKFKGNETAKEVVDNFK